MYNLGQKVVDKLTKLSKNGFFFGMFYSCFFARFYQNPENLDFVWLDEYFP